MTKNSNSGSDSGGIILIIFLLLVLVGLGGFAYWYYVYRCHAKDWTTSNLVAVDTTLKVSNVNVSVCTAQANARKGGYPAFFLTANSSGKYDAYFYPTTQKTISLPAKGTATLYYWSNTITISSSVPSPSPSPVTPQQLSINNFHFNLVDATTGNYVCYDGNNYNMGTASNAIVFSVFNNSAVYDNISGCIALQTYSGPNANKLYMRHSFFKCWSQAFVNNSLDFAWLFNYISTNGIFTIYNSYGGSGFYLDIVNNILQITNNTPPRQWQVIQVSPSPSPGSSVSGGSSGSSGGSVSSPPPFQINVVNTLNRLIFTPIGERPASVDPSSFISIVDTNTPSLIFGSFVVNSLFTTGTSILVPIGVTPGYQLTLRGTNFNIDFTVPSPSDPS